MEENLGDRFFDLLMRVLNYAAEFVNDRGYASLRFMDLFSSLLELQPFIKEISQEEFYDRLRKKIKERQVMEAQTTRAKMQSELLDMFLDEWRRRSSQR